MQWYSPPQNRYISHPLVTERVPHHEVKQTPQAETYSTGDTHMTVISGKDNLHTYLTVAVNCNSSELPTDELFSLQYHSKIPWASPYSSGSLSSPSSLWCTTESCDRVTSEAREVMSTLSPRARCDKSAIASTRTVGHVLEVTFGVIAV